MTTLAMIMAGGAGTRLYPLTQTRTKPAVPFAGNFRLIDFVLNNFVNSDLLKIYVLTQFKSQSLNIHLRQAWYLSGLTGNFIDPIPAQMRMGKRWYEGTADAIYQNLRLIEIHDPDNVCVFGSDHIYKMDIRQVVDYHKKKNADLTVCGIRVPIDEAHQFGVIEIDKNMRMIGFEEKPEKPKCIPGMPDTALVSMGNYVFKSKPLYDALIEDAEDRNSSHDFGKNVIPKMYPNQDVFVYDFADNRIPNEETTQPYWRDVGTLDSFWQANMDMLEHDPGLDLYNPKWPMRSYHPPTAAASILADLDGNHSEIHNSSIASGSHIEGAKLSKTVVGFKVTISPKCELEESVILGNCKIGVGCRLRRVICDKSVDIADNTLIGFDRELDESRGFTITDSGITVVPKGTKVGF